MNKTRYVFNTLLQRAFREGRSDFSPMKAQKILFYTHGWHLAITGTPAIDKHFAVWPYGPVVEEIYHDLKRFGSAPISAYVVEPGDEGPLVVNPSDRALYQSIDIAWEKYIGIPAVNLSAMTHEPGSPWDEAKRKGLSMIPDSMIRDYFVRSATTR